MRKESWHQKLLPECHLESEVNIYFNMKKKDQRKGKRVLDTKMTKEMKTKTCRKRIIIKENEKCDSEKKIELRNWKDL